jgi:hypothetical protein
VKTYADISTDRIVLFVSLAAIPFLILWQTWAMWLLWNWFLPPLGVPGINMGHAFGLNVLVKYAVSDSHHLEMAKDKSGSEVTRTINRLAHGFLFPGIAMVFGWIAARFFM